MINRFYVGSLEIVIGAPDDLFFLQWEDKFNEPAMKIQDTIEVSFEKVDELLPVEGTSYELQNAIGYDTEGGEVRVYRNGNLDYALSRFDPDAKRVYVYYIPGMRKSPGFMFRPWYYIHLEELLLMNDALILHSASIISKGEAIIFSAPSGTGKTTQTDLWHKYRQGITDLNGDKNLLQKKKDGSWVVSGFPIFGGSMRFEQKAVPIRVVAVIRQAKSDRVRELSLVEKITLLYSETTVLSYYRSNVEKALDLLEDFALKTDIVELDCTMNESAVEALEQHIQE